MGRDLHPTVSKQNRNQPEKWTASHRRVVALEMAGMRIGEIAALTGYDRSYVSTILADARADLDRKLFAEKIVDRVSDIQLKIALHADEALQEIVDEMRTCEKPEVRQRAAFGILDRAGYAPRSDKTPQNGSSSPASEILRRLSQMVQEVKNAPEVSYRIVEPTVPKEDLD